MTLPKRKCLTCGKTLIRKRREPQGKLERVEDFKRRKYCSNDCKYKGQVRDPMRNEPAWKPELDRSMEKMRLCLACGKEFLSCGPGNRICPNCKKHPRESIWEEYGRHANHL